MKAPVGKIARLPEAIREQLNQRLQDGVVGKEIVSWLNSLPEVNQVVAKLFAGNPITQQNISEWRRRSFQEWLGKRETQTRVLHLAEMYQHLEPEERLRSLSGMLAAQLMDAMNQLPAIKDAGVRWRRLQRLCWEFARLRKFHTHGLAVQLQHEKALSSANPSHPQSSFSNLLAPKTPGGGSRLHSGVPAERRIPSATAKTSIHHLPK
jgi:hypothetical protein